MEGKQQEGTTAIAGRFVAALLEYEMAGGARQSERVRKGGNTRPQELSVNPVKCLWLLGLMNELIPT